MAYSELVKSFEKVRAYMRNFYVYGFKSRSEYNSKSARSYDDERRRIDSWLHDFMRFSRNEDGKSVFISVDSRSIYENPFYKAWKTKSFTDGDITLHFLLFDILTDTERGLYIGEIIEELDTRLSCFEDSMSFDESTVRKKLKEYELEGLIATEREGKSVLYRRLPDTDISTLFDALCYFSEIAPCGVVGSYLLDKGDGRNDTFSFKHHYITSAIDSDILAELFDAMGRKAFVTADLLSRRTGKVNTLTLLPLRVYISAQNGRQNLIAYIESSNELKSLRLDYMANIRLGAPCPKFDALRSTLSRLEAHMWGVNCRFNTRRLEHIELEIYIGEGEEYIRKRLLRECRCGTLTKLSEQRYLYTADVFDTEEMTPWLRTFISRIIRLEISNKELERRFRSDLERMYRMYGIGGDNGDIQ